MIRHARPRVLLVDNYDSFTFNLVQALRGLGARVGVRRHDAITVEAARRLNPTHLVISPGPGRPSEAGVSQAMIEAFLGRRPVLGVCLGHQALVEVLGGEVGPARRLMHGKASRIYHDSAGLFEGIAAPMEVGRYHSLAARRVPKALSVSAVTDDGEVMAVRHRTLRAVGVQFHPESILTPEGDWLLGNFLSIKERAAGTEASLWPGKSPKAI